MRFHHWHSRPPALPPRRGRFHAELYGLCSGSGCSTAFHQPVKQADGVTHRGQIPEATAPEQLHQREAWQHQPDQRQRGVVDGGLTITFDAGGTPWKIGRLLGHRPQVRQV